jgi:hypothetical protein
MVTKFPAAPSLTAAGSTEGKIAKYILITLTIK